MTAFDVGLCQYALGSADSLDDLCARVDALFDRAGPADLYVLPELFLDDLRLRGEDTPLAETALDADERERYRGFLADAAATRDAVVVGGSYDVASEGGGVDADAGGEAFVNRLPLATPDGEVLTYDKRHPTPNERAAGKRGGDGPPPVVEHRGVGVGVVVCYDVEFPETVREVVDRGAEVLAVPSWTGTEAGYQRVRRCAAARAVENQAFVAQVPLVGARGDAAGTGGSAVFAPCDDVLGPHGTRLRLPRDEAAAATCRVDVGALRRSREAADVRPYADATERF